MQSIDLILDDYGLKVGKESERITVRRGDDVLTRIPARFLRSVLLSHRGISLSTDALELCADFFIPVALVDFTGSCVSIFGSPKYASCVATRRAQLLATSTEVGFEVARTLLLSKLRAQVRMLRYIRRFTADEAAFERHIDAISAAGVAARAMIPAPLDVARPTLLGHEGIAARSYWQAWSTTLGGAPFPGRKTRGAADLTNSMLNYGYAILRARVHQIVTLAGLDSYAGFLHADRPGRASMVLDLMEPYRVIVEDVVGGILRRSKLSVETGLHRGLRERIVAHVNQRLDAPATLGNRRARVAALMLQSTRALSCSLRERAPCPEPFRWNVRGPKHPSTFDDPLERLFSRRRR